MKFNIAKRFGCLLMILIGMLQTGCKKYLDQKTLQSLVVPSSLSDAQALLDNSNAINANIYPDLAELGADNIYVHTSNWNAEISYGSVYADEANIYIWNGVTTTSKAWNTIYQNPIYYSNIVLDVLPNIATNVSDTGTFNSIKGSALFYRAFAFFELAQLYCRPYSSSASADPGIVLRLNADINDKSMRGTVQQTYDQITSDLQSAASLLPVTTAYFTRPCKAAAYGLLARTYLSMGDYINAGKYANLYLQQFNVLIDYNTLTVGVSIPSHNAETIFYSTRSKGDLLYSPTAIIDSNLYASYDSNDLRKTIFFNTNAGNTHSFRGSYDGTFSRYDQPIASITSDEMYLIRAEAYARAGNTTLALQDLNALMVNRWKNNGSWVSFSAIDASDALAKILVERRKELVYRGLRWSDLRRLNLAGANIILTRVINNTTYSLPPNDLRYVLLLPLNVVSLSGVAQNPR